MSVRATADMSGVPVFAQLIRDAASKSLEASALFLKSQVDRTMTARRPPAGSPVGTRTASLRRSLYAVRTGQFAFQVTANIRYARIHEFGGKIVARGGSLLVPISDKAERYSRQNGGKAPSDLVFIKRRGKAPLLVKPFQRGRGSKRADAGFELWYVLLKSVRIPARPFMRPGLEKNRARAAEVFQQQLAKNIRQGARAMLKGATS